MGRSTFSAIILGVLANAFPTALAQSSTPNKGCLCTSDQPCWPSAATFALLQSQVSQPLIYPVPTASGCYPPSDPTGNCTDITVNWGDGVWRANHPGSMELANFETFMFENGTIDACYLNTSVTGRCEQGRVPVIGVDARSVADVQTSIGFAVEHGLKLVVKNTGHDFIGRSAARGAFVIWTHHMKNITYDAAFVPRGAPANETFEAVTIGAGVQWYEAYSAVNEHGRMMVGGVSVGGSVGAAGGWLAGGGHSFLSPTYGLGVDNALEISIVLSTGEYLVTNGYQNQDLFWALRGGGPSTYGIVTSVTYRTYPQVPLQIWFFNATTSNSSILPDLIEGFLRYTPQITDAGWGGYGSISNQGVNFAYFAPNMTNETLPTTTQGWVNFTQSLAPYGVVYSSQTYYEPSWYDLISLFEFSGGTQNGGYVIVSSRLLSRDTVENNYAQVAPLLIECTAGFNTVAGGKVSQIADDSAGLNPAWRRAVIETTCGTSWDETTPTTDIHAMIQQLRGQIEAIYDATPNDGAYLNEASPFEVNWKKTFFGSHYAALKDIKDKYDPIRLFVVAEGVGSEEWNRNLTCWY